MILKNHFSLKGEQNNKIKFVNFKNIFNDDVRKNTCEEREKEKCDHKWKAIEEAHYGSYIKLRCVKCGETKGVELFP